MGDGIIASLVILLGLGSVLALVGMRLGIGALTAYLLTGMLAGPSVLGWVDQGLVEPMSQCGAALLLFALGLELDLSSMASRAKRLGIASGFQVGVTILAGWLGALALGLPGGYGTAMGACLAMSSTLLVLRVLDERKLRNREEGQLALGLSLLQDVAVGPLLVLLSFVLPVGERPHWHVLLLGVAGLVVATVVLRRTWASRLVDRVRASQAPELEVAVALVAALGAAWFADSCGLGAAAGAFSAGLAFGRGPHQKALTASMAPLLGLASILFFIATGIVFDLHYLLAHPVLTIGGFLGAVVVKAAISGFALRLAGLPIKAAIGTGIIAANIGEFALILSSAALGQSADPGLQDLHHLVVSITILSFLAMPVLMLAARPFLPQRRTDAIKEKGTTIVVAGLGPVGNTVVSTLHDRGWPVFLVDRNPALLKTWETTPRIRCHLGRIEDVEDWLPVLGHRPALVVLTFPIPDASAMVTRRLRAFDADLPVIARSPYQAQIGILLDAGVQQVICDEQATADALLPLVYAALRPHGAVAPTMVLHRREGDSPAAGTFGSASASASMAAGTFGPTVVGTGTTSAATATATPSRSATGPTSALSARVPIAGGAVSLGGAAGVGGAAPTSGAAANGGTSPIGGTSAPANPRLDTPPEIPSSPASPEDAPIV